MKDKKLKAKAVFLVLPVLFCISSCNEKKEERVPMKDVYENSLVYKWQNKEIYDSLLIDDMERQTGWSSPKTGTYSFTNDRSIDGNNSLRLEYPMRDTAHFGSAFRKSGVFHGDVNRPVLAILNFSEPMDWTKYNRLSFWVYVNSEADGTQDRLRLMFGNEGIPMYHMNEGYNLPQFFLAPKAWNYYHTIKAGQWNKVYWEIPEFSRDKVTNLTFMVEIMGHGFGKEGTLKFDIDRIQLERVDADRNEGWLTLPGKISFCHTGYTPEGEKIAVASGLKATAFQLIDGNEKVVLEKPIIIESNDRGTYQLMDFTEIRTEGTYHIHAGEIKTRLFRIADDVWNSPVEKALNFFFVERCGYHVPGIHDVCHKDWQMSHNGEKKVINGGWHDAGDMCQGANQTGMAIYAMLELAKQLALRGNEPELLSKVSEEAEWGLRWLLNTRFPGGYRMNWSTMRIYTDNQPGTMDDVITPARNEPWMNFMASGIEAYACAVFHEKNPELAQQSLKAAEEDWKAAAAAMPEEWYNNDTILNPDPRLDPLRYASWGVISSLNLFKVTGNSHYAEMATAFGRIVLNCQETSFKDGIPITGYFYNTPEKKSIVHFTHQVFEESPLLALTGLCEALPAHENWMEWYAAVVLHSEYFMKRGSEYSSPYHMLASSVYSVSEVERSTGYSEWGFGEGSNMNGEAKAVFIKQIREGARLSDDYYLRRFPVQVHPHRHGSTAIQLSESAALAMAYRLRNNRIGEQLVIKQMEWILGNNPFSQSIMYGEGYDYTPLFSGTLGNIVGALPVGVDCLSNDEPNWYNSNHMTTKEVWAVPTGRFLWNMSFIGARALLNGRVKGDKKVKVSLIDQSTGEERAIKVHKDGTFTVLAPAGDYRVQFGMGYRELTMLRGCQYEITCDPDNFLDFKAKVDRSAMENNKVLIAGTISGNGSHKFKAICFNCQVSEEEQFADLSAGGVKEIYWNLTIQDSGKPWVVLLVPDNDYGMKLELTGDSI